ncbi:hypothetical protein ARMSODRAFT_983629 [Armillaria solidipes]|uniref:Uncharacterized protein n=1 Tax=Armillaria solidipes TaxID=1076256 RepID=A0A2H3B4D6_9AGAR|nr:hypothetical protein ARMSODRAFT_983629 [Armillaria solidipes]
MSAWKSYVILMTIFLRSWVQFPACKAGSEVDPLWRWGILFDSGAVWSKGSSVDGIELRPLVVSTIGVEEVIVLSLGDGLVSSIFRGIGVTVRVGERAEVRGGSNSDGANGEGTGMGLVNPNQLRVQCIEGASQGDGVVFVGVVLWVRCPSLGSGGGWLQSHSFHKWSGLDVGKDIVGGEGCRWLSDRVLLDVEKVFNSLDVGKD